MIDRRPTASVTSTGGSVISLVIVRCYRCPRVWGLLEAGARFSFTCHDRGCNAENQGIA